MANIQRDFNDGVAALKARQFADAERLLKKVLRAEKNHVPSLNLLTIALMQLERFAEAEPFIAKAVQLNKTSDVSFYNYGLILKRLKKPEQALQQFNKAIEINPTVAETWNNRGTIFNDLKQYKTAVADFERATELYPRYAEALANKGKALCELREHDAALAAYDKALTIAPGLAEAWLGRGIVLFDVERYDEALAAFDKACALNDKIPELHLARGNVLAALKRFDEAFLAYDRSFILNPDQEGVEGARLNAKMRTCNWHNYAQDLERLTRSVRNRKHHVRPFAFLSLSGSARDQLICATSWTQSEAPRSDAPRPAIVSHDRIRVGYVSADFHQHATAHLMAGVFEKHDRAKFETSAISYGPNDRSELRTRLEASFDRFIEARPLSDEAIAAEIRAAEIDILVDLKGYTGDARPGIFAVRAAPIQVSYLGYPGTLGADFIDYLIADRIVIPENSVANYAEKIVFLPDSYQANDDKRVTGARIFTREAAGLPANGFVFCCFNNNYKITPSTFDSWMRILARVEGSVLWLFEDNAAAAANLRQEAAARSVSPDRLVFAGRLGVADHLARHRLADLFLDTLPYNAHTTASDALWAGLPVLTQAGATFAGRVAASLLHAVGLPELITNSPEDYEALAIELANDPGRLAAIKDKLATDRAKKPLFDTARFTRHLEQAYLAMYHRQRDGRSPDHLTIERLSN